MKNKLPLFFFIAVIAFFIGSKDSWANKTYIYAWKLPVERLHKVLPRKQIKPGKVYVLIWASPWKIHHNEKKRLLNGFPEVKFVNKGYAIRAIDRKLIESGKYKLGLVMIIDDK